MQAVNRLVSEQDRIDWEIACSRSRLLVDAARLEREFSEVNRWAAGRERAYARFLSLRRRLATAESRRVRSALTLRRARVQLRNARLVLERAREFQRHSQIAIGSPLPLERIALAAS